MPLFVWPGISVEIMALIWPPQLTVANSFMFFVGKGDGPSRKRAVFHFPRLAACMKFTTKYNLNATAVTLLLFCVIICFG